MVACGPSLDERDIANDEGARLAVSEQESFEKLNSALPWERYVSNDFLPGETNFKSEAKTNGESQLETIRIGLPWLPNDQIPALWLGMSRGYFAAEGLQLDIVPGGPGRDNLLLLLSGKIDLTIASSATAIIRMLTSDTGGQVVAVAALQKEYPYAYLAIDQEIPKTETSQRIPKADDFRGKVLGMTPGGESFLVFALEKLGLQRSDITIRKAGSSLVPLTNGVFDFYTTMTDNNPRKLEAMGFQNWMLWEFSEHGWVDYHNVVSALPETLETKPEIIRAFLRALDRSLRAVLDEDSTEVAQEILPFVKGTGLTTQLIARRLELQRPLTIAKPAEPILHMTTQRWTEAAAMLWRLGIIDIPDHTSSP